MRYLFRGCVIRYSPENLWLERALVFVNCKTPLHTVDQVREVMQQLLSERDRNWTELSAGDLFVDCAALDEPFFAYPVALILAVGTNPNTGEREVDAVTFDRFGINTSMNTSIRRLCKRDLNGTVRYPGGAGAKAREAAMEHLWRYRPRSGSSNEEIGKLLIEVPRHQRAKSGIVWAAQRHTIPDTDRAMALFGQACWIGPEGAESVVAYILSHEPAIWHDRMVLALCQDWCSYRFGLRPGDVLVQESSESRWVFKEYIEDGHDVRPDLLPVDRSRVTLSGYRIDASISWSRQDMTVAGLTEYRTLPEKKARTWRRATTNSLQHLASKRHAESVRVWGMIQEALWGTRSDHSASCG